MVGFVASMNQTLTKWYSNVSFQHTGDDVIHKLKIHVLESLRHYHKVSIVKLELKSCVSYLKVDVELEIMFFLRALDVLKCNIMLTCYHFSVIRDFCSN